MTDNIEVVQDGGTLRAVHAPRGPVVEAPQAPQQSTRVHNGALQLVNGEVRSTRASYQAGVDDAPPTSIMQTAKRMAGGLTVQLVPGDESSRTLVQTAVRHGLVVESAPGHYVDRSAMQGPGQGEPGDAPPPVTDKPAGEDEPFQYLNREHLAEWNQMIEPLPQATYDSTMAVAVSAISSGEADLGRAVQRLTRESGMDPTAAQDLVDTAEAMYRHSLTQDLARAGLVSAGEADHFYEWCRGHRRINEALSSMLNGGQTRVFRELARDWSARKQAGQP